MITTTLFAVSMILSFVGGFSIGVFGLLGYMLKRLMSNLEWDDSNITNALRLLSQVVLHPQDFLRLYYMTDAQLAQFIELYESLPKQPFWFVKLDELSEVVKSRP